MDYMLEGEYGLPPGLCVMSISVIGSNFGDEESV